MSNTFRPEKGKKGFAVLVDPDKQNDQSVSYLAELLNNYTPDVILVGGSLLFNPVEPVISNFKQHLNCPVYLFPGDVSQVSARADGILLLSLISGRNPDFLIGNHVIAAPSIRRSGMDIIPTGYILIENGHLTSVEYVSNTRPIPFGKIDLAVATAMAGEMLGMKQIYLEAGSGAAKPVGIDMIKEISENINLPLVVGGGIRTSEEAENVYRAGADVIVIGNRFEEFPDQVADFITLRDRLNSE